MSKIRLNVDQQKAVDFYTGAAMVIAGAGSGKTRVITSRIQKLIEQHGTFPGRILALTFTNKAAKEMLERISHGLASSEFGVLGKPLIGTFHSYCFLLLKKYSKEFGLESFGIMDASDQQTLVKKLIVKYGLEKEFNPRKILGYISNIKNKAWVAHNLEKNKLNELFFAYEQEKKRANNLDFDDLLLEVYKNLKTNSDLLNRLQDGIDHILIDEYQDTNEIQHELIKLLALKPDGKSLKIKSIFAVGDQDQSIYSWRGALVENMNRFLKDFAPAEMMKIEQNYRSAQEILCAANSIIKNNPSRIDKNLWSENEAKNCIFLLNAKNEYQEAEVIIGAIKELLNKPDYQKIAVLYRNHSQSRLIEEALIQNKLKYLIVGGIRFYERKEIKDLLAYLKLIHNSCDWLSLERIINIPARGLGDKFWEKVELKIPNHKDFRSLIEELCQEKLVTDKQKAHLLDFLEIVPVELSDVLPSQALEWIIRKTKYEDYLKKEYELDEAQDKLGNIEELAKSIKSFESTTSSIPTVSAFLEEIALIQEASESAERESQSIDINLMTLHSAKGLEFDFVAIIGLEDGNFPSKSRYVPSEMEEERRLFYVGVTRAKLKLLLSYADSRMEYGKINRYSQSRFIDEIPQNLLNKNTQNLLAIRIKTDLQRWLASKDCKPKTEYLFTKNY